MDSSDNDPSSSKRPTITEVNPFTIFSSKNDDQASVVEVFEEEFKESKTGEDLTLWLSLQLPPGILMRRTVMSNTRLFTLIFQFLRDRQVLIKPNTRYPFIMQVASSLYSGEVLDKCMTYLHAQLNNIVLTAQDTYKTEEKGNYNEKKTEDDEKTRKLLTTLSIRFSDKKQFSGTENFHNFLTS